MTAIRRMSFVEFIFRVKELFDCEEKKGKMSVFVRRVVQTNVIKKGNMTDRQSKIITHDQDFFLQE